MQQTTPTPEGIVSAAILALMALWPRYSYRISGTVLTRSESPTYGILVNITPCGAREGMSELRWAASWDEAVEDAAYAATALILPYTKLSRKTPWRRWQGKVLPPLLYASYQRAQKLADSRRYDEALHFYYKAVEQDPHNRSIRLQIAMLQERLGLFIDALDTYVNLRRFSELADEEAGMRRRIRFCVGFGAGDALVAWYRYVITLGTQDKLAEQWHKTGKGKGPAREAVLEELRTRLKPVLWEKYGGCFRGKDDCENFLKTCKLARHNANGAKTQEQSPSAGDQESSGEEKKQTSKGEDDMACTELFFLHACREEASKLHRELSWLAWKLSGTKVSRAAVQLIGWPWVTAKTKGLEKKLPAAAKKLIKELWASTTGKRFQCSEWSDNDGNLERIERDVDGSLKARWFGRPSRNWMDYYNAACVWALTASLDRGEEDIGGNNLKYENKASSRGPSLKGQRIATNAVKQNNKADPVDAAIENLNKAMLMPNSPLTTRDREWLLVDDPDLVALRKRHRYRRFKALHFPSSPGLSETAVGKPSESAYEVMLYTYYSELVASSGKVMESRWHQRAKLLKAEVDVHEQRQWWEDERETWKAVADVCGNYRHWPSRANLISKINSVQDLRGARLCVSYRPLSVEDTASEEEQAVRNKENPGNREKEIQLGAGEESAAYKAYKVSVKEGLVELGNHLLDHLDDRARRCVMPAEPSRQDRRTAAVQVPLPISSNTKRWINFLTCVDMGSEKSPDSEELVQAAEQRAGLWQPLTEWFASPQVTDEHELFRRVARNLSHPREREPLSRREQ